MTAPVPRHAVSAFADLCDQLRRALQGDVAAVTGSDATLNPWMTLRPEEDLVPAAVLVLIVPDAMDQPAVVLTERTAQMTKHAGQVSFPGGRIDADDAGPVAAALREAAEEIGLTAADAARLDILGHLPPYVTGTGYRVTAVVAALDVLPVWILNTAEVASVFTVPLDILRDPAHLAIETIDHDGHARRFYACRHADRLIWGATAAMLKTLVTALEAAR